MKTTITARELTAYADEPIAAGGTNMGMAPTELLLGALGACAAITARLYAERKGWALEGVEVDASFEKFAKPDYPDYQGDSDWVNEFRQRITFTGDLTDDQRERLLEIAGKCPVHRILTTPNFMIEELAEMTVDAAIAADHLI